MCRKLQHGAAQWSVQGRSILTYEKRMVILMPDDLTESVMGDSLQPELMPHPASEHCLEVNRGAI